MRCVRLQVSWNAAHGGSSRTAVQFQQADGRWATGWTHRAASIRDYQQFRRGFLAFAEATGLKVEIQGREPMPSRRAPVPQPAASPVPSVPPPAPPPSTDADLFFSIFGKPLDPTDHDYDA